MPSPDCGLQYCGTGKKGTVFKTWIVEHDDNGKGIVFYYNFM
jgi:hypothetical protein